MALLLKSGKQILGLSSVAKSQQQLGLGLGVSAAASKYLFTTYTKSSHFGVETNFYSTNKKQDNDFEIPPRTLKSFFTSLFGRRYSPPPPPALTPFQELVGKFMDLAEESKYYSEDRLPRILDDICPILNELLYRMTDESMVKFVYEFARPAASSPPVVIDRKIKVMVDKLPPHVIHLFQDTMIDVLDERYAGGSFSVRFPTRHTRSFVLTADVSRIGKEHLKLFVVKNHLLVTGTDKAAPPASAQLLALSATIHNLINMPSCPYSRDEITASILEDQERGSQLKIVVPCRDVVVNKPRVFQLNLDAHQG